MPRWRLCRSDQARIGDPASARIEHVSVVEWGSEVRVIQDVKKLRPELRIEAVGDGFDVVVFE